MIKYAKKKEKHYVEAYQLGAGTEAEKRMIEEGKIVRKEDNSYELFSTEAVNGSGEIAQAGDYFKIDGKGYPYPNEESWFENNHEWIRDNTYLQKSKELAVWQESYGESEEIDYLIRTGKLIINEKDKNKYYSAHLFGAMLSAAHDAYIIFYQVERDSQGQIQAIDFNFVEKGEFERDYSIVK